MKRAISTLRGLVAAGMALALAAGLAAPSFAAFEDLGAGARAPGMGNAFTAISDDLYAVYYNPAGLAQMERPQLSATYNKLYMGLSDGSDLGTTQLTYAQPLRGGQWGGVGTAFSRFSLNSIYSENSMFLSYGRTMLQRDSGARLMGGVSAKYLQHSFAAPTEAGNSCNNGMCGFGSDPVLSGSTSKGAMDADVGFLYRFPRRWQAGMMIQHFLEPDVAFAGGDKLRRSLRFAGAYKSLWMNLATEVRMSPAPDGSTDRDLIFGAEKFVPTLDHGTFGLRGSLAFGSREWRQLTMGLSYRISKIEMDYAFLMPMGTVKGTLGSHTAALTFHFGAATSSEELTQDLLEQQRAASLNPDNAVAPHDINDPRLVEVLREVQAGRFRRAYRRMEELLQEMPPDQSLVRLANRLRLISNYYPQLTSAEEKWEQVLLSGIHHVIRGKDRAGALQISYALSINPKDKMLEHFLADAEGLVGVKAPRAAEGRDLLQELLYRMESSHNNGDFKKVFAHLSDIQTIDPKNPTALERAGSTYYILGRYQDAITVWQKAMTLETSAKERESLQYYLDDAARKLKVAPAQKRPAAPETPKPQVQPAPAPQPAAAPLTPSIKPGDERDIPSLYQRGVEHYARGEYLQATSAFVRILKIDPNNEQARKALERIRLRNNQQ
ncbi:MAG: hypothetical protein HY078_03760 [Elusimicrobia bacterium]|nr:hypothetical protein [Elusimicrobiota bacterium]